MEERMRNLTSSATHAPTQNPAAAWDGQGSEPTAGQGAAPLAAVIALSAEDEVLSVSLQEKGY